MTEHQETSGHRSPPVKITRVRIEHLSEAFGIGVERPRLSWMVETSASGWHQNGYEIECRRDDGQPPQRTGRIESDQSVLVDWPFEPLASRERLNIRVRVWGAGGRPSAWSQVLPVEASLLHPQDWTARFVTPGWEEDISRANPAALLRREFDLNPGIKLARLYITALGVYEAQLNGRTAGDQVMAPGWTSYHHRLRYQTFDVTDLLHTGRNAFSAMLGDGWFRGRMGFGGGRRNIYGERTALLAQLEITYADGTTDRIVSDETWHASTGPILSSEIYDGETYDASLEIPGWAEPGFHEDGWTVVRSLDWDMATLVAPCGPPIRRMELVTPLAINSTPSGRTMVDFGQNLVGKIRLKVQGPAGQTVTVRHGEVLENGELCTRTLRLAKATDRYTLRGDGIETWEPHFTFHGFRYAEIGGWPGELRAEDVQAVVCHSDMERTGWFECSDELINQFHENVVWSMRGNFFDIPTDCPQRDERLGWTGDLQVFSPTACFLYDTAGFLASWLRDLDAEQQDAGGLVPVVVPNTILGMPLVAAAWSDAAVIVPWVLYQRFGDKAILATQFESMRTWVDRVASLAGKARLWDQGFQFGDWLDPAAPSDRPVEARTDPHLVATAYFARSAELVGRAAGVLGLNREAACYLSLASEIRQAFSREYITPAGRSLSDTQTAYALALEFELLTDLAQRKHAAERLAKLVRANGYHVGTGFVGTPLICDALCDSGYAAAAYRLLMQRECPAWLYPVTMGATTIWERWDSLLPDGSVNPGEMTSFNHYALGAVADWLQRTVGGLAPLEPGYRRMTIQPRPGGGLSHASARHLTPYGMAECAWIIQAGRIDIRVVLPPNTTARVILPSRSGGPVEVGSGIHNWSYPYEDPDAPQPLSIDNTIGEISEDRSAWAVVLSTLERLLPGNPLMPDLLQGQGDTTLRHALMTLPQADQVLKTIAEELADLGQED